MQAYTMYTSLCLTLTLTQLAIVLLSQMLLVIDMHAAVRAAISLNQAPSPECGTNSRSCDSPPWSPSQNTQGVETPWHRTWWAHGSCSPTGSCILGETHPRSHESRRLRQYMYGSPLNHLSLQ